MVGGRRLARDTIGGRRDGDEMEAEEHVGSLDDFPEGQIHPKEVAGAEIVLIRVGDDIFACGGICSHADAYLDMGRVEEYELFCPLHAGRFDIRTGEATHGPATEPIPAFTVRIDDGEVYVGVSSEKAAEG